MNSTQYRYDVRHTVFDVDTTPYDIRHTGFDENCTVSEVHTTTAVYTVRKKDRMYDIRLLPKSASYPITIFHASSLLSRASAAAATQARTL